MKLRVLFVVMCAALLVVPAAFAETTASMSIAGDVETNTTLEWQNVEIKGDDDLTSFVVNNSGRTKIKFSGMLEGDTGWFAAAKGDALISTTGTTGVDDAWVQFGSSGSWSVLVGRYEAWSTFSKGEDVYIASAPAQPARYEGNYWRGRFGGDAGNIALQFGDSLEIGFILGGAAGDSPVIVTETDPDTGNVVTRVVTLPFGLDAYAIRPVYKFSGESFAMTIGGEYGTFLPQDNKIVTDDYAGDNNYKEDRYGASIDLQGMFGASTIGLSGAYGKITGKTIDDRDAAETDQTAIFGWWKMAVGEANTVGLGFGWAGVDVENVGNDTKLEGYAVFIQQLPVEGLKIKYAASYAGATLDPEGGDSFDISGFVARIRLNYDF
jgi:hypothetical protein